MRNFQLHGKVLLTAGRLEDDEYGDEVAGPSEPAVENVTQSAIDITSQFVFERLNHQVVANLVLISLVSYSSKYISRRERLTNVLH